MKREQIIQEIETLKPEAIRRGFDYPTEPPLSAETTRTLKRFLGELKQFINDEREYDRTH